MLGEWWGITSRDLGWRGNIERRLMRWLYDRFLERLLNRHGGIQQCPWCKQCAQAYDGSHFDSKTDPMIDALHCGNCGGVSKWRFEMGMIPLDPIGIAPPSVAREDRETRLREALIHADLKIRSFPGADQSDVAFIREALGESRDAG